MQNEQRPQATPNREETKMTNPDVLKVAAIKALIETIEGSEDAKDATQVIAMIKTLIGSAESK
jgi:hypothetical protein